MLPNTGPLYTFTQGAYVLVSCDCDGESIILLPWILEAGNFCVHSEPILRFSIKLLSGKKKIHITSEKFIVNPNCYYAVQTPTCMFLRRVQKALMQETVCSLVRQVAKDTSAWSPPAHPQTPGPHFTAWDPCQRAAKNLGTEGSWAPTLSRATTAHFGEWPLDLSHVYLAWQQL